jgi:type VI secretion system VasD/TssJ family lipoprotein
MSQAGIESAEQMADISSTSRIGGARPMRFRGTRVLSLLALVCAVVGCATSSAPKKACLVVEPTETLNLYDGQPHSLTIYIYPLAGPEAFEQTHPDDLLAGARPAGVIAPPVPFTIEPSEAERTFQELFPTETTHLGVIADYERAPGDPEGIRSQVVPARCGIFKPKIRLSSRDMLTD